VYAAAGGGGQEQDPTYFGYTAPEQQPAIIYAIPMEAAEGDDNATYYTADATPHYNSCLATAYHSMASQSTNQKAVHDLAAGGNTNSAYDEEGVDDTEARRISQNVAFV
jgi:hypothetical protein